VKAKETPFLGFLKQSTQFVIPIYQRSYSWDKKQCQQLWEDIVRAGSDEKISVHFVGSIVYVEDGLSQVSHQAPLLVIDGQQRLTTLMLILEALSRNLSGTEPQDGFTEVKIKQYYLTNHLESGDRFFKLILSDTDKETLKSLIKGNDLPEKHSIKIKENFEYFEDQIKENINNLEFICNGLSKLVIVDIALSREHDNPQLIFESMNSTGKALSQADLIRNYILMGLTPELQTQLFEKYWRPMEIDFGQEAYGTQFDYFMRHYLTVKTGQVPRVSEVYEEFKNYALSTEIKNLGVNELVNDIRKYSKYYCAMALGAETNPSFKSIFQDLLQDLNNTVAFPLLLELYDDFETKVLSEQDFVEILRLIESYIFRRSICEIPTNSMNKTFAEFSKHVVKSDYLNSIKAYFLSLPSYRRFPKDEEFKRAFEQKDLYNYYSRSYWLKKLENFERKEKVTIEEYTIEHIMPQNERLSKEWQKELGDNWNETQTKYLHTLGNLTLTGYNSEYSDKSFKEKKSMKGGFLESPLKLNKSVAEVENWNETSIKNRANLLSELALKAWKPVSLDEATLIKYRKEVKHDSEYTIDSYVQLKNPETFKLYEKFKDQVLKLDPCVTIDFLKYYIAFKAETNFVDLIPTAKGFRLTLNMSINELNDPKGEADDLSGKGRWGNGDVSIKVTSEQEIPYVLGLIRQSLEKQLGTKTSD
jgi:uncharacterized protein with ParB-like and HNH nuclease domain/predicted transport protein